MTYQLLVLLLGISSVLFPALIVRRSHLREQRKARLEQAERLHTEALILEERALFFEKGRAAALAEVEKIRDDRGVSYRDAAKIAGHKCAECNRKCIHCAREAKSATESNEYDDYDADTANCEPVKTRWPADTDLLDDEDDLRSKPRTLTGER